jgi:hypothetical protein
MRVLLDHLAASDRTRTMWSEAIILFLKQLDFFFCVLERREPVDVQAFIAEAAVELFDERIIRWFARPSEVQRHLVVVSPLVQRLRDEFAPVVALDALGTTPRNALIRSITATTSMPFRFWPSISRHSRL